MIKDIHKKIVMIINKQAYCTRDIWKLKTQSKYKCFIQLYLHNKIITLKNYVFIIGSTVSSICLVGSKWCNMFIEPQSLQYIAHVICLIYQCQFQICVIQKTKLLFNFIANLLLIECHSISLFMFVHKMHIYFCSTWNIHFKWLKLCFELQGILSSKLNTDVIN